MSPNPETSGIKRKQTAETTKRDSTRLRQERNVSAPVAGANTRASTPNTGLEREQGEREESPPSHNEQTTQYLTEFAQGLKWPLAAPNTQMVYEIHAEGHFSMHGKSNNAGMYILEIYYNQKEC